MGASGKQMKKLLFCLLAFGCHTLTAPGEIRYRLIQLEQPIDTNMLSTYAMDISESGFVAGHGQSFSYSPYGGLVVSFLVTPDGVYTNIGAWRANQGYHTRAYGVNDRGQTAVYALSPRREKSLRFTPGKGFLDLGYLGQPVTQENLPYKINSSGQVAGRCETLTGYPHAYRYTDGIGMEDLGTLGSYSGASGINDSGWVSGISDALDGLSHAYLFKPETGMVDLGPTVFFGGGAPLNNRGVVASLGGSSYVHLHYNGRKLRISRTDGISGLHGLADINDQNAFVGDAGGGPFIGSEAEGIRDLSPLVDPTGGWRVTSARGINNRGQIAGQAYKDGRDWAVRLDPIPPKMQIQAAGTNVIISWTPAWPDVALETSDRPDSAAWVTIPHNNTNILTVPISAPQSYFRLTKRRLPSALD